MRLSEAILLGDSLKRPTNSRWINDNGNCGCAFGGALVAAGIVQSYIREGDKGCTTLFGHEYYDIPTEHESVNRLWPWLTIGHLEAITRLYEKVMEGTGTIEEVADYVASVEPAEPYPSTPSAATASSWEGDPSHSRVSTAEILKK